MLFHTVFFISCFTVVWIAYWLLHRELRWQNWLLLAASYFFYGSWDWRFLFLLLLSTTVDFYVARWLERLTDDKKRRRLLYLSLVFNLGVLGFFKYFNFFVGSASHFMHLIGYPVSWPVLHVILPLGISFYTFQTLGYVLDVYRKRIPAARRFDDFALFVSFFPQLVAGPIERASDLLPQIENPRQRDFEQWRRGLILFIWGVWLKMVVADGFAPMVNNAYTALTNGTFHASIVGTWLIVWGFTFQIYADFYGYSLMARGIAKLLGFTLQDNFRFPLFSRTLQSFWRRWHTTLSDWFRENVYIPLGGNRFGNRRTAINLIITMTLVGLWHGARWTFVAWGMAQGIGLVIQRWWSNRISEPTSKPLAFLTRSGSAILTPTFFALTLVLFRAQSFHLSWQLFSHLLHAPWYTSLDAKLLLTTTSRVLPLLFVDAWQKLTHHHDSFADWPWWIRTVMTAACLYLIFFYGRPSNEFIYFAF